MQKHGLVPVSPFHQGNSVVGRFGLIRWDYRNSVGSEDEEHSVKIDTSGRARSHLELVDFSGEPAGTRTQGPRLKSSKRRIIFMA